MLGAGGLTIPNKIQPRDDSIGSDLDDLDVDGSFAINDDNPRPRIKGYFL